MTGSQRAGLIILLMLGAGLRFYQLGELPFEQDELYTLRDASALLDFPRGFSNVSGKPLYYVIQSGLLPLLPSNEFWLRFPAFVFGLLGLWATWALARDRFGVRAGLVTVGLLAVAPWHLYLSQFARYWSLVYLIACVTYLLYFRAQKRDSIPSYAVVLGCVGLGLLSHPTFIFPLVGFLLGAHLVTGTSKPGFRWPSRSEWLGFWIPLLIVAAGGILALFITGNQGVLRNKSGRGIAATLRLVPAIIQWLGPVTVTAFVLGIAGLLVLHRGSHLRWSVASAMGVGTTLTAVLAASFWSNVYAEYSIAMLPLLFVSIGGALQAHFGKRPHPDWLVAGVTLLLLASVLPSTASYMSDGNRFDYRPALEYIERVEPEALVVGHPEAVLENYSAQFEIEGFPGSVGRLESYLEERRGFWLIASFRRYGMQPTGPGIEDWIATHCRRRQATEAPRLDYRRYRVELHWCGSTNRSPTP